MNKTDITVKLTRAIILAGQPAAAGETITVAADTAQWLIQQRAAERLKPTGGRKDAKDDT